jgi:hypothetical protein
MSTRKEGNKRLRERFNTAEIIEAYKAGSKDIVED